MNFTPYQPPFPSWLGPYSPARGTKSGFRIKSGELGAWVHSDESAQFWLVGKTSGTRQLEKLVEQHWRGGRILFLPCGYVVKPLQDEDVRGERVVIGEYEGEFVLEGEGKSIDFSRSNRFLCGSEWLGPSSIGLECTLRMHGSLVASWYYPSDFGQESRKESIANMSTEFISIFQRVRPYSGGARVRLTIGGHVITNKETDEGWKAFYISRIDTSQFSNWGKYIRRH